MVSCGSRGGNRECVCCPGFFSRTPTTCGGGIIILTSPKASSRYPRSISSRCSSYRSTDSLQSSGASFFRLYKARINTRSRTRSYQFSLLCSDCKKDTASCRRCRLEGSRSSAPRRARREIKEAPAGTSFPPSDDAPSARRLVIVSRSRAIGCSPYCDRRLVVF